MALFDAIGGAVAKAANAAISAEALAAAKGEAQKLLDSAKSGGFKISENAVKDIRKSLLDMQTQLDELRMNSMIYFTQTPMLGSHEYGRTVAAHDQRGAANHEGSASVVLDQLSETLKLADEALARAAGVYQETESNAAAVNQNVQA